MIIDVIMHRDILETLRKYLEMVYISFSNMIMKMWASASALHHIRPVSLVYMLHPGGSWHQISGYTSTGQARTWGVGNHHNAEPWKLSLP